MQYIKDRRYSGLDPKQMGLTVFPRPGDYTYAIFGCSASRTQRYEILEKLDADGNVPLKGRSLGNYLNEEVFWLDAGDPVLFIALARNLADSEFFLAFVYHYRHGKFGWVPSYNFWTPICECPDCTVVL